MLTVGPAGVGKGRLIAYLVEEFNVSVIEAPRLLRAAVVSAPNSHRRAFSWREFFIACLEALEDPLPEEKVELPNSVVARARRATEAGLRRAVLSAVCDRGLHVLFVDEALALVQNERGRTLRHQLDVLRDLADASSCKLVLVATPRLLGPLDLSGELARRMAAVAFPRYWPVTRGSPEGQDFLAAVKALLEMLPAGSKPRLGWRRIGLLGAGSLGCVGLLVQWFDRAVTRCLREGADALDWRHFEETVLPDSQLATLQGECEDGERRFGDLTVRTFGGLSDTGSSVGEDVPAVKAASSPALPRATRASGRVGLPKPRRHEVA